MPEFSAGKENENREAQWIFSMEFQRHRSLLGVDPRLLPSEVSYDECARFVN